MVWIWISAFVIGVVIGIVIETITWDEEKELQKIRFEKSKKNIRY